MEVDIIATLRAQAASLSYTMENLIKRNFIAPSNPTPSISCIYCKGRHLFENCPYNPDSLCYGFLPRFANQHQYQCFQQEKMIPKEPTIGELIREYMVKQDVVMQNQATYLQNLEIQVEQITNELKDMSHKILLENIETSKQEDTEQCEAVTLQAELEHEDLELPVEAQCTPTPESTEEPKGREEEPPQEEKEPPMEVGMSYAVTVSQQMTSKELPILEAPAFTYCSLQEKLNEEECKMNSMMDDHLQDVMQVAIATTISTSKGLCKSLEQESLVVMKAPQLRLKSRPSSRPRCKMKEHGCGLPAGIG